MPPALERARSRLDRLDYYPSPVRADRIRLVVAPWLFRLPYLRRFAAYAFWRTIAFRDAQAAADEDLLVHELCHVWQAQHRPLASSLANLRYRYEDNPFEAEAHRAVAESRGSGVPSGAD